MENNNSFTKKQKITWDMFAQLLRGGKAREIYLRNSCATEKHVRYVRATLAQLKSTWDIPAQLLRNEKACEIYLRNFCATEKHVRTDFKIIK
jgi:hypothetical protein